MVKFIHLADIHLNNSLKGRRDSETGLPLRVLDILNNLDMMVDHALNNGIELVVFAGDYYRENSPPQIYKSLFQERVKRLADAGIKVILLVGNHDCSKSIAHRHAVYEFKTLEIENVFVIDEVKHLTSDKLGLPCQIIGIPWQYEAFKMPEFDLEDLPILLTAHATVWGSTDYADNESEVVLGKDFLLDIEDLTFADYVALGHIHNQQVLNENPPVIYPGSAERLTWGEIGGNPHGFVVGELGRSWKLIPYKTRERKDIVIHIQSTDKVGYMRELKNALPQKVDKETMYRLTVNWPTSDIEPLHLEKYFEDAFEIVIRERKPRKIRAKGGGSYSLEELNKLDKVDLLGLYFDQQGIDFDDELKELWEDLERSVDG